MAKSNKSSDNSGRGINQGALFVNDKEGNEKRPDVTGKLILRVSDFTPDDNGNVTVFLAGWKRESEKIGEYTSLRAQPPQQRG